jgi:hypothetical protein
MPDAPSGSSKTLSETTSTTIVANNSFPCSPGLFSLNTAQNSYYRVFSLASLGVTTAFQVTNVTFQVELARSAPTATLTVGTYSGTVGSATLKAADITAIQTDSSVTIPDADDDSGSNPGTVNVPISATIPAGSNLIVELAVPSGGMFYIGTSASGESAPGYTSTTDTADCTPPGKTPTSMSKIAGYAANILLTVTGTY